MSLSVNLSKLSRRVRVFLRLAAADCVASTKLFDATESIAGHRIGILRKTRALAEASVRRKLRRCRLSLTNLHEVQAFQGFLDTSVRRLEDFPRSKSAFAIKREIHRFARSLHLANILEMHADAA